MFYAPKVYTTEVAKVMILGGAPIDVAIGVLAVTIHRAYSFKNPETFNGTPVREVVLSIYSRTERARIKTVRENADPL